MRQIIKNEWRSLVRNRAFLGLSIAFLGVLLLSLFFSDYQKHEQSDLHTNAKEHVRQQWTKLDAMNPHSAAHYGTYVFKPSGLLSSLDEGVNSVTGNVLRLEGHVQNEIVHPESAQMQTISRFGKLKPVLLLQYIIPLLLIFLAFNAISSEKQSGRLKLLVLQGAKAPQIIFSKIIAIWLYGIALLTLVVLVYALLNFNSLTVEVLSRSVLFFLSYALYYFIVVALTIFFSARWQSATLSLTAMLGIWIIWTLFLPNLLMSAADQWHPLPSRNTFLSAMKEDRAKGLDGHNPLDERAEALKVKTLKKYGVDSLSQLPINFDGIRMQADEEYGNSVWDKHFGKNNKILSKQKRSYQWLGGVLSPFASLQNASMGFTGTDNVHHQAFLKQAEKYRRVFVKMLNDKQTFGGSKTGDWGWQEDNAFYKSVPDFKHEPTLISSVFTNYLVDVCFLLLWVIATILLAFFGTKKLRLL